MVVVTVVSMVVAVDDGCGSVGGAEKMVMVMIREKKVE